MHRELGCEESPAHRIKRISTWRGDSVSEGIDTHFFCIEASTIPGFPDIRDILLSHYRQAEKLEIYEKPTSGNKQLCSFCK